jgi:hypothetical protein
MNTFKRKALFTAVVAGLGAAAGTAEAVYLNPNSVGQALVYPYYTVQSANGNSWNTYISVVNTTSQAKAVKVRFLEGKTSAETLDFNLYLSPNDVWTAAIVPATSSDTAPGHLITTDVSCTSPAIPAAGVDFSNALYGSDPSDSIVGTGLERSREGYAEIIEMGVLSGTWAAAVTHNSAGIPANCGVVQAINATPPSIAAPTGGLIGTGTLINVNNGMDSGYKADALEAWSTAADFNQPGQVNPRLDEATPPVSVVVNSGGLDLAGSSGSITVYRSTWTTGAEAVASVFMHTNVLNEYILDSGTLSNTDWVITQPLKRAFVDSTAAIPPYTNKLLTNTGACESISFTFFNREEQTQNTPVLFSPQPAPGATGGNLCWESTVLSIVNGTAAMPPTSGPTGVLGSVNKLFVTIPSTFQNGWANLKFTGTNATSVGLVTLAASESGDVSGLGPVVLGSPGPYTFTGLPVTGFMIRTFDNGTLTCGSASCQGNYASLFRHSYVTGINP